MNRCAFQKTINTIFRKIVKKSSFHLLVYIGRVTSVIRRVGKLGRENLLFAVNVPLMHMPGIDPNVLRLDGSFSTDFDADFDSDETLR